MHSGAATAMTDRKEDGLHPEIVPEHWMTVMNRLWLRVWRVIGEDAVTDEDRRDARGDVQCGED